MNLAEVISYVKAWDDKKLEHVRSRSSTIENLSVLHNSCLLNNVDTGIEVGTHLGFAGLFLASAMKTLHTLDIKRSLSEKAEQLHKEAGFTNIKYWVGNSRSRLQEMMYQLSRKFQFAYIDADHVYSAVMAEYKILSAHIAEPGVIFFDDATMRKPGDKGLPQAMKDIGAITHPVAARLAYKTFGDFKVANLG